MCSIPVRTVDYDRLTGPEQAFRMICRRELGIRMGLAKVAVTYHHKPSLCKHLEVMIVLNLTWGKI